MNQDSPQSSPISTSTESLPMSNDLPPSEDALLPDAPIHHLLSLKHNPRVADMTDQQVIDFVQKLRALATSAPTLSAKLASDSDKIKPKREKSKKSRLLAEL